MKTYINGTALKLIAIITMTIDHIAAGYLACSSLGRNYSDIVYGMRVIGRLAFPLYIFLLVEGYFHTKSKKKYLERLLALLVVSEIPFHFVFQNGTNYITSSVMATLSMGFVAIIICGKFEISYRRAPGILNKTSVLIGALISCSIMWLLCYSIKNDYGFYGVAAILGCYIARKALPGKKGQLLSIVTVVLILCLESPIEIVAIVDALLIYLYDGTKGTKNKIKNLIMNTYYPVHLGIIAIAKWLTL